MNIFLNANIILDLIDIDRGSVKITKERLKKHMLNGAVFYTSCNIFTNVYYVASKNINYTKVIQELEKILTFVEIVVIDIDIINSAIKISKEENHKDLEDILQYICAKVSGCKLIITNDKSFYSKDIEIISINKGR